jgi:hypothetical protein
MRAVRASVAARARSISFPEVGCQPGVTRRACEWSRWVSAGLKRWAELRCSRPTGASRLGVSTDQGKCRGQIGGAIDGRLANVGLRRRRGSAVPLSCFVRKRKSETDMKQLVLLAEGRGWQPRGLFRSRPRTSRRSRSKTSDQTHAERRWNGPRRGKPRPVPTAARLYQLSALTCGCRRVQPACCRSAHSGARSQPHPAGSCPARSQHASCAPAGPRPLP